MPADYLSSMGKDIGVVRMLERDYPGRILAVLPLGGLPIGIPAGAAAGPDPDYRKFDRALKAQGRPVLTPLQRVPFRDFRVEEFMGRTIFNCRGSGGCRSIFLGSPLTLGQMADACVYVGTGVDTNVKAGQ